MTLHLLTAGRISSVCYTIIMNHWWFVYISRMMLYLVKREFDNNYQMLALHLHTQTQAKHTHTHTTSLVGSTLAGCSCTRKQALNEVAEIIPILCSSRVS